MLLKRPMATKQEGSTMFKNPLSAIGAKIAVHRPCTEGTAGAPLDPQTVKQLADIDATNLGRQPAAVAECAGASIGGKA